MKAFRGGAMMDGFQFVTGPQGGVVRAAGGRTSNSFRSGCWWCRQERRYRARAGFDDSRGWRGLRGIRWQTVSRTRQMENRPRGIKGT